MPDAGLRARHSDPAGVITVICPPGGGGVRDYAEIVAEATGSPLLSPLGRHWYSQAAAMPLASHPPGSTLFVQVSHYGYQRRGVPIRLLRWLKRCRRMGTRIGCYFHELYAYGKPWNSSFWLSPFQRYITCEIAKLSDFWITNQLSSAEWLLRTSGSKPHRVLPVFSNLGEAERYTPRRTDTLVVCGSPELRAQTYHLAGPGLLDWAKRWSLNVHDVGSRLSDRRLRQDLCRRGVIEHGMLSKQSASSLLSHAKYGAVAYPAKHIAKSGIFAAYCAHGVCPLVITEPCPPTDGLAEEVQYLRWPELRDCELGKHSSIASRAFEWYSQHSISVHSRTLLAFAQRDAQAETSHRSSSRALRSRVL